jgi:CheY-like chemotaxis protein
MDPNLLNAIASLLWPLTAIGLVIIFRPAIAAIIESAKSRKFTVKIAGQELTMEELSDQQRGLIADLQAQVIELRKKVEGQLEPAVTVAFATASRTASILWVDDNPRNNSILVQQLADLGISVDLALSTAEGAAKFERNSYLSIISDMGRREDGSYRPNAGLELIKLVRAKDSHIPIVIFCASRLAREYGQEALGLGATAVTSSPTELFGILRLDERREA